MVLYLAFFFHYIYFQGSYREVSSHTTLRVFNPHCRSYVIQCPDTILHSSSSIINNLYPVPVGSNMPFLRTISSNVSLSCLWFVIHIYHPSILHYRAVCRRPPTPVKAIHSLIAPKYASPTHIMRRTIMFNHRNLLRISL